MRTKKQYAKISVSRELHEYLKKERDKLQELIGGGSWSIDDTICYFMQNSVLLSNNNK